MNKELTQALQPILDQAVTDCKQLAGAKLGVLFQIGQHILSMERAGKKYRPSDKDGLSRADAIRILRIHIQEHALINGYEISSSNSYWYAAAKAAEIYTYEERTILIKGCTPWPEMNSLIALADHGRAHIAKLADGRIDKIRVRNRGGRPKNKTLRPALVVTNTGSAGRADGSASGAGIIEIIITGGESTEQWEDIVASVLSAAARCDQDPVRLTDLALKRTKR